MTRLIRVHGYYGPLFCIFFQGHLSRRLAPQTRPPARSPNGRLGSGDLHPMSLTSVPACHRQTSSTISSQSHLPIKWRQKYVTEHGRNPTTLWSAALAGKELPFAVASRFEHRLDEAQHSAVSYSLSYQREEFFMVRGPEEVSEIRIDDPL